MENGQLIDRETFDRIYAPMGAELIHEIIEIFMKEYPDRLVQFEKDVAGRDMENLARTAHSLKGVVSNLYAQTIVDMTENLVQKGLNNDFEGLDELHGQLKSLLVQFVEELELLKADYK